jgi:hypothetical protein
LTCVLRRPFVLFDVMEGLCCHDDDDGNLANQLAGIWGRMEQNVPRHACSPF